MMRCAALQTLPSAAGQAPVTIHGEDIQQWLPHWREGRPHRLELRLAGGDVVLFDIFALRVLHEVYLGLVLRPGGPRAT